MTQAPPLQNTKALIGKELHATDGTIGHVKDFYFDDQTWMVRYLVVDTGTWLTGRQVVLASEAFDEIGDKHEILKVNLLKHQIESSPSIGTQLPLSRQYEREYYNYYGWTDYWGGIGMAHFDATLPPTSSLPEKGSPLPDEKPHLRSVQAIHGYHIKATDGELGHVDSLLIGAQDWQVHQIVVKTGVWNLGKEIHLFPEEIESINYGDSSVEVRLSKDSLADRSVK